MSCESAQTYRVGGAKKNRMLVLASAAADGMVASLCFKHLKDKILNICINMNQPHLCFFIV